MADEPVLPQLLRARLRAQADLFEALTSHPTLIGSGREDALAELLRQFIPRRFEILSGTVALVDANQQPYRSTHQLDIIVADTVDFPTLLRLGNLAVVLSQSVRAVLEVKSDLKKGVKFITALIQIARARQLLRATDPVFTGLFSFGAPTKQETLRDWLEDVFALRTLLLTKQGDDNIRKIRDALLSGENKVADDEEDLIRILANGNLPDVVAADKGAVARQAVNAEGKPSYMFLGSSDVPAVMVLIDYFVERLGTTATATAQLNEALAIVRAHLAIDSLPDPDLDDLPFSDNPIPGLP